MSPLTLILIVLLIVILVGGGWGYRGGYYGTYPAYGYMWPDIDALLTKQASEGEG